MLVAGASILVAGRPGTQDSQLRQELNVYRSERLSRLTPAGVICCSHIKTDLALMTECSEPTASNL